MSFKPEQVTDSNPHKYSQTDRNFKSNGNQLQGINSLVIDAVVKITDIVESMHHRVSPASGMSVFLANKGNEENTQRESTQERTSGITGAVYKAVRGITELVGKGLNIPLKVIGDALQKRPEEPGLIAVRSALNGVLGDYLEDQNNPLAIDMHFTAKNQKLSSHELAEFLAQTIENNNGKLLLMVHGLCMNDRQWCHNGHDHGTELVQELGASILSLNYNSGLHISQNGQQLADLLQAAITSVADKDKTKLSINLVTHSMGGLVSRSALQYAKETQQQWPDFVDKIVFLGTPHHGAPLEKTGNWLDLLLASHPYTVPFAKLIQVRSSGITDLRFGNICHQDWQQRNRFDFRADNRKVVSLTKNIECFTVAGSIGGLVGDGLVEVDSALGRHTEKTRTLQFKTHHQLHVKGADHMQLLSDPRVYEQLVLWLCRPK